MKLKMYHNNFNVLDLEKSLAFYEEALDLKVVREINDPKGSYKLRFLANDESTHQLELTRGSCKASGHGCHLLLECENGHLFYL